jgi:hypothetical protein
MWYLFVIDSYMLVVITMHELLLQKNGNCRFYWNMDSMIVHLCYRKALQGGIWGGSTSKSHHGARGNNGGSMNAPGNKGGWSNRSASKSQLGPDKQHRQSGMLSGGKKGDQNKIPLSKSVW